MGGKIGRPGVGDHPEGGAVRREAEEGPGATRLRKPPPRVARTLRPRPRRQSLPHSSPRRQPQSRPSPPAPSRTPPRDGHGAGKRTQACAETARACADPRSGPSPPPLARLPPASFPGHLATSQRVTYPSSNHSRFPREPWAKRRAGRGEGD